MVQPDSNAAAYEIAVGGEFMAAAVAGLALSSQNDEATTLAGQKVVGFTRPLVKLDAPTMNTLAVAGVTVLTPVSGGLEVRDYLTTDTSSELASLPYVTTITDFISKGFRAKFKPWTGRKVTPDVPSSMQVIGNEFLKGMVNDKITAYAPCSVTVDKNDPTTINVEVSYVPMFSTRWININFSVNLSSN
jgi:hypothetical protein